MKTVTNQAQDPDIVATSLVLSLKCPVAHKRLVLPVRATTCKHLQCFDATSYLQLQEQGPQWLCPVCDKSAPYDTLAVDEYALDILENTAHDLEQVRIDSDGTWHTEESQDSHNGGGGGAPLLLDDFQILPKPEPRRINGYGNSRSSNGNGTIVGFDNSSGATLINSRDTTATPNQAVTVSGSGSVNKRTCEVIDLISDDDDEKPQPRPLKKKNTGRGRSPKVGEMVGSWAPSSPESRVSFCDSVMVFYIPK